MSKCYPSRAQPLPSLWLISDARNDAVLEAALARLPRGSGFVFRHYHLDPAARRARFDALARAARARRHLVFLAGDVRTARAWGADGAYGSAGLLARGPALSRLVTAHGLREIGRVRRVDAVVLSPVYPTRSHPGAKSLGPVRFRLLSRRTSVPVIALGGINRRRAAALGSGWAAIDGLS